MIRRGVISILRWDGCSGCMSDCGKKRRERGEPPNASPHSLYVSILNKLK